MRIEQVAIPMIRQVAKRPRLADALFTFDKWGNPFSAETLADPMVNAPAMRAGGPVQWRGLYQQWFIMGFDEARQMLGSPHVGTANQAEVLLDVTPYSKLSRRSRAFLRNFLVLSDPPNHTRVRSLVNRAFTPKQVSRLDERMAAIIDDLIADFGESHETQRTEIELMTDFAVPFPARVIAELFGMAPSEWKWLRDASSVGVQLLDPIQAFDPIEMDTMIDDLYERVIGLAEQRRAEPRNDLITGLALAEADDGDRLSEDELVSIAGLILFAGHETTAAMFANSLLALYEHPEQLALLRNQPELWPNAIDEFLRFCTSVVVDPRSALVDFEFEGHKIKKGQNIVVLNHLANRDLTRFADADELKLDRDDPNPISFGHGIHYCLGANLARAELLAGLPRLLDALGDYSIDRSRIEWRPSQTLRAALKMPICFG